MTGGKVALVHDWLTGFRGGEKVLHALCELYPEAEIFTLIHVPGSTSPLIESRPIHTSFLQRLPNSQIHYRRYLPLFPQAIERLDLSGFPLVISTSHAVAKGCRPAPDAVHLSYVHTPMRYVWDQFDAYFGKGRAGLWTRLAAHAVAPGLRRWDVASSQRLDGIIANSKFVSARCLRFWGRAADAVVYPPVDLERFAISPAPGAEGIAARLRPDRLGAGPLQAGRSGGARLRRAGRRLVIAGGGPELSNLSGLSKLSKAPGPPVELLGPVSDARLLELYQHAAFFVLPGEEDFGIAPVEAQACGRPVLALGRGGALETVRAGETGVFFAEPTEESLLDALPAIDALARDANPEDLRAHAARFSSKAIRPRAQAGPRRAARQGRAGQVKRPPPLPRRPRCYPSRAVFQALPPALRLPARAARRRHRRGRLRRRLAPALRLAQDLPLHRVAAPRGHAAGRRDGAGALAAGAARRRSLQAAAAEVGLRRDRLGAQGHAGRGRDAGRRHLLRRREPLLARHAAHLHRARLRRRLAGPLRLQGGAPALARARLQPPLRAGAGRGPPRPPGAGGDRRAQGAGLPRGGRALGDAEEGGRAARRRRGDRHPARLEERPADPRHRSESWSPCPRARCTTCRA